MVDQQYPLYHPELEHESCGVGAIVDLSGRATHRTVDQALTIPLNSAKVSLVK